MSLRFPSVLPVTSRLDVETPLPLRLEASAESQVPLLSVPVPQAARRSVAAAKRPATAAKRPAKRK